MLAHKIVDVHTHPLADPEQVLLAQKADAPDAKLREAISWACKANQHILRV
jgi:hypothetical protein